MIMQPETGKLSVREKIGYSLGDGAANFIFSDDSASSVKFLHQYFRDKSRCDLRIKWNKYHSFGFLATDLLNIKRCTYIKTVLKDFLQNRPTGHIWSFQECFSFSRLLTSSSVPLNGPGVSILIDTRAAANFNDSGTS